MGPAGVQVGTLPAAQRLGLHPPLVALVGGSDRTIQLQPISVSGNTGIDVAAGVADMTLEHVPGSCEPHRD